MNDQTFVVLLCTYQFAEQHIYDSVSSDSTRCYVIHSSAAQSFQSCFCLRLINMSRNIME